MKTNECDENLGQFLIEMLPDETREAFKLLMSLPYPLNDYRSAAAQIKTACHQGPDKDSAAGPARFVLQRLGPRDFPIATSRGALEKFSDHLHPSELSRFFPPIQIPDDRVESPPFAAGAEFIRQFGPFCAQEASAAYRAAKRRGSPDAIAFIEGVHAGRHCLRSLMTPPPPPPPTV